ncbi:CapA family protein [Undibacterium sp. CY18W]|uniref:CapA family protein n=1 Tax=Undibacterium hunanense TaxID=2762292 RepID=A0ABR6ZUG6_9BURK|nr:CapA family protein [Undibacterium hunanense]MBC3919526.1 CapA family protein [Undibacterium hunanense]
MKWINSLFFKLVAVSACALLPAAVVHADNDSVSILFAGDVVLDGTPGKMIAEGKDPFHAFASLFKTTDIRVVNLECVVATTGDAADKNFTFRAHPRTLAVLKQHVDAVSIANNHSGDFGRAAFQEMLGLLDQQQLLRFGGGSNLREAHTPLIIEKKGLRIALLGYNEFMPRSFEAEAQAAGVAWSEDEQVIADIRQARQHYHADLVIPFMHWGWENDKVSVPRQRQLARKMIDAGADAVIGGHPHVIQDVEHYQGKPIIYSLGNFVMDELDNEPQTRGWVLRLQLDKKGVLAWNTRLAKIDDNGVPHPVPTASTACWKREGADAGKIGSCSNAID